MIEILTQAFVLCMLLCLAIGLKINFDVIAISPKIVIFVGLLVGLQYGLNPSAISLSLVGSTAGWFVFRYAYYLFTKNRYRKPPIRTASHSNADGRLVKPTQILGPDGKGI